MRHPLLAAVLAGLALMIRHPVPAAACDGTQEVQAHVEREVARAQREVARAQRDAARAQAHAERDAARAQAHAERDAARAQAQAERTVARAEAQAEREAARAQAEVARAQAQAMRGHAQAMRAQADAARAQAHLRFRDSGPADSELVLTPDLEEKIQKLQRSLDRLRSRLEGLHVPGTHPDVRIDWNVDVDIDDGANH